MALLQRSHALTRVEKELCGHSCVLKRVASTEPRAHARGKAKGPNPFAMALLASTEPRAHARGKVCGLRPAARGGVALQRSHALTRVESNQGAQFPRYGLVLQRSHALTRVERQTGLATPQVPTGLQRSHALTRVERVQGRGGDVHARGASTEPRAHARGKGKMLSYFLSLKTRLQRSHALTRVERPCTRRRPRQPSSSFNGATRSRAWKGDHGIGTGRLVAFASTEPRAHARGKAAPGRDRTAG